MPGKSRRRKGKYSIQSKRHGVAVQSNASNAGVQPPTIAQATPVSNAPSPRVIPSHSARLAAQMAKPAAIRYAFVATELRTIGILAGIMLILLVVLARVLA